MKIITTPKLKYLDTKPKIEEKLGMSGSTLLPMVYMSMVFSHDKFNCEEKHFKKYPNIREHFSFYVQ